ncbi:polysaccharide biosynthesis protein [Virgibacillus dakarensis]|uniref:hypothetical protein n=1 Tax=Virgibacillus dakarensis TaxID=1917889 RepID=UPI000B42FB04|nr:hypothetical protein [Virgibacillus dakarensis]
MKKKIISDVLLNILASVFPIFILQFILLPLVASDIDANSYGYLITIIAWINLSALTLGSVLNNSRLIYNSTYEELNFKGDYNILLLSFLLINILITPIGVWYFEKEFNLINIVLMLFISIFMFVRGYAIVEFRIKLNYKYILLDSVYVMVGYGVGYVLFIISDYWQLIYLCGFVFSFLFVVNKTNILREPFNRTPLFKKTSLRTFTLLVSALLNGVTVYLDKLLLFPLLGGLSVSIYYTATILGKTITLVIGPTTGVFLSYLARLKKIENKSFLILLVSSFIVGVIGYFFVILISKPLLGFLYPQFVSEALNYIYITTLSIIITITSNILNPVILKFCGVKWQVIINFIYLINYTGLSLILLNYYGLMGFCIGILIASIIKLFSIIIVYFLTFSKKRGTIRC